MWRAWATPILLAAGVFLTGELNAAGVRHNLDTHTDSGVTISVQPYYSNVPTQGFLPARVSISNHSGRAQEWSMTSNTHDWSHRSVQTRSRFRFSVPHGESSVFDVLIPVGARAGVLTHGGQTTLQFSGAGVQPNRDSIYLSQDYNYRRSGRMDNAFIGMSQSLHSFNWGQLQQDPRATITGAAFNPDRIPGDWRGLSGFTALWLTDTEWRGIGGIERQAILDWTASGGWLFVCREAQHEGEYTRLAGLPSSETNDAPIPIGFGMVHYFPREGNQLDIDETVLTIGRLVPAGTLRLDRRIHEVDWVLFQSVGLPRIPVFFFSAFLTVFAILVGPVNFVFFARPGRRHRLLWTTPLISIGIGSLLIILILFHDGTGGTGRKLAVWHHLPEENKAVVLQEQVARTGLMVSSRFSPPEPSVVTQLDMNTGRSASGQRFDVFDNVYDGDWFLSRSAQAQLIKAVPSSRSRIELTPAEATADTGVGPEIVSTMPHTLETIFYRDNEGAVWRGGPLVPGDPLKLEPADEIAFEAWWRDEIRRASPVSRDLIDAHKARNNYFFASASGRSAIVLDTHRSIDWSDLHSIHLGPLLSAR